VTHCNFLDTNFEISCIFIFDKNKIGGSCKEKTNITGCSDFYESSQCLSHNDVSINEECVWIKEEVCIGENTSTSCSSYISKNNCTETIEREKCFFIEGNESSSTPNSICKEEVYIFVYFIYC
jgi:hypothetical protein